MQEKDYNDITSILKDIMSQDKQLYEKLFKENKEFNDQYQKLTNLYNDAKSTIADLNRTIEAYKKKILLLTEELDGFKKDKITSDNEYRQLLRDIDDLKRERTRLKEQLDRMAAPKESVRLTESPKNSNGNTILAIFNSWAARPMSNLPNNFYYVLGNIKIRTKQDFDTSKYDNSNAKWIISECNGIRYLFPNPIIFNDRTDISELYQGNIENLKPEGNKIQVLKPCEMSKTGFIEFPGEFKLIG
jgi:hypothetical protein